MTGIDVKHIPYRGTPAVVAALLAKEVDYAVELLHAVRGQVQAGELKLLAVGSPARWPAIPNVPTVAESGVPGYAVVGWYGWLYPAGTPQPIVDKTYAALKEILARPEIQGADGESRRGGACLDAGRIRQAHRRTRSPNGRRCATRLGSRRSAIKVGTGFR